MKRIARIVCLVVLSALVGTAFLHADSSASRAGGDEDREANEAYYECLIAELHAVVQERFKEIDKGFGYRRLVTIGDSPHNFTPENEREAQAVEALKKSSLEVTLYLSGRSVLGAKPEGSLWKNFAKNLIKGPLAIAGGRKDEEAFDRAELWQQSRRAMLTFKKANQYSFSIGQWKFSARPVRAADQSCLKCHTGSNRNYLDALRQGKDGKAESLALGDPLGVILYGYRRVD
jgi:hypothetical protein